MDTGNTKITTGIGGAGLGLFTVFLEGVFPVMPQWLIFILGFVSLAMILYWTTEFFPSAWANARNYMKKNSVRFKNLILNGNQKNQDLKITAIGGKGTVETKNVAVVDCDKAVSLNEGADSEFKDTIAVAPEDGGSVGFEIKNSPRTDLSTATAKNYKKGFVLDNSPDSDLSGAKAETKKHKTYQVRWPENVPRSSQKKKNDKD